MSLLVHIVTPDREVWSGEATMVGARGTEGEVGILSGHAPMLIRLSIGVIRIQHQGGTLRAVVDGGFLHVTSEGGTSRVDVLASHAELEDEIDLAQARRDAEQWERHLQERDTEEARVGLARATTRIALKG